MTTGMVMNGATFADPSEPDEPPFSQAVWNLIRQ
jgi:hypothetical protein